LHKANCCILIFLLIFQSSLQSSQLRFDQLYYMGNKYRTKAEKKKEPLLYFRAFMCYLGQRGDKVRIKHNRKREIYYIENSHIRTYEWSGNFIGHYINTDEIITIINGFVESVRRLSAPRDRKKAHAMWLWIRDFIGETFSNFGDGEHQISDDQLRNLVTLGYKLSLINLQTNIPYLLSRLKDSDRDNIKAKDHLIKEAFRGFDLERAQRFSYYYDDIKRTSIMVSMALKIFRHSYSREADTAFNRRCKWILQLDDLAAIRWRLDTIRRRTEKKEKLKQLASSLGALENHTGFSLNDTKVLDEFRKHMYNPSLLQLHKTFDQVDEKLNQFLKNRNLPVTRSQLEIFKKSIKRKKNIRLITPWEHEGRLLSLGLQFQLSLKKKNISSPPALDSFLKMASAGTISSPAISATLTESARQENLFEESVMDDYMVTTIKTGGWYSVSIRRK